MRISSRIGRRLGSTGSAIFAILSICITKQRKAAAEQRAVSLFFTSPNHRQPRISAENEMSIADNLWAKQQNSENRHAATHFVHLMNASER